MLYLYDAVYIYLDKLDNVRQELSYAARFLMDKDIRHSYLGGRHLQLIKSFYSVAAFYDSEDEWLKGYCQLPQRFIPEVGTDFRLCDDEEYLLAVYIKTVRR